MRVALMFLIVVFGVTTAVAAPKVALPAIDGDDSGDIREAVAEALDSKELSVLGAKETNRTLDKLKIDVADITEKQAKKLATELEANVVMAGTLGKEGKSKVLKFRVFINGKKVKSFSVTFSNPRSKKFKDAVHEKMVDKLAATPPPPDATEEDDDDKKPKVAKVDDDKKKKKKKKKTKKADGEPDEEDETPKETATAEDDEDEEEDEDANAVAVRLSKQQHAANRVAFRVDVGSSFSARSLTFTFTPELAQGNAPSPFKPGPVMGVRAEGEIFPLSFASPEAVYAGILGVGFEVDQVLSSKVQTSLEPGATGVVKQFHFSVGPRVRFTLGNADIAPAIMFGVSYGRRQFVVTGGFENRDMNLDLPDTDYSYIAPLFSGRVPLGTPNLALVAQTEIMLVKDAGRIADQDQYGRAKVFGIDAQGGLDIVLKRRFALRLLVEYTQIGFAFTGGGEKSRNRDLQPETVDIGGALDRSIGGVATLGILY